MHRINSSEQLTSILKTQLSTLRGSPSKKQELKSTGTQSEVKAKAHRPELSQSLLIRVRAISKDDSHRRRKAFQMFLETTLSRELGVDSNQNIELSNLAQRVCDQMEGDIDLRNSINEAGEILLAQADAIGIPRPK